MIPTILLDMKDYISKLNMQLSNEYADRINSSTTEKRISMILRDKWSTDEILFPEDCGFNFRCWWDFWLVKANEPGNFKVTMMQSDNSNNFLSILYVFGNVDIDKSRKANAPRDTKELKNYLQCENQKDPDRDYWFFVMDKKDTSHIVVNSLKGLTHFNHNPSNLPFQINWSKKDNEKYIKRNSNESWKIIKKVIKKGLKTQIWKKELYKIL